MSEQDTGRHMRGFFVSEPDLLAILRNRPGGPLAAPVLVGVPEGAELMNVHYDYLRRAWWLCFEHESFPPVPFGEQVPSDQAGLGIVWTALPEKRPMVTQFPSAEENPLLADAVNEAIAAGLNVEEDESGE